MHTDVHRLNMVKLSNMTTYSRIILTLFSFIVATASCRVLSQDNDSFAPNASPNMLELFTSAEKDFIASKQVFKVCNVMQQASKDASLNIVS